MNAQKDLNLITRFAIYNSLFQDMDKKTLGFAKESTAILKK